MIWLGVGIGVVLLLAVVVGLTRRGMRWGAARGEPDGVVTGDSWLEGGRLEMTRAISIDAPPETVWPWLAQIGRGAGWYSYDRLDNGGRPSARHIVGWIPEPAVGDAAAIGYLRHLEPGREIVWWTGNGRLLGSRIRGAIVYRVSPEGDGSRVLMRVSAQAGGWTAWLILLTFPVIDSIMAVRQLRNLKARVESYGARTEEEEHPETGERDQYQLYQVIFASGGEAGVKGKEAARDSRREAEEDGVL